MLCCLRIFGSRFLNLQPKINPLKRTKKKTDFLATSFSLSTPNLSIQLLLFCHAFGHFMACHGIHRDFQPFFRTEFVFLLYSPTVDIDIVFIVYSFRIIVFFFSVQTIQPRIMHWTVYLSAHVCDAADHSFNYLFESQL